MIFTVIKYGFWIPGFLLFTSTWPYILAISVREKTLEIFILLFCILILIVIFTFPDSHHLDL